MNLDSRAGPTRTDPLHEPSQLHGCVRARRTSDYFPQRQPVSQVWGMSKTVAHRRLRRACGITPKFASPLPTRQPRPSGAPLRTARRPRNPDSWCRRLWAQVLARLTTRYGTTDAGPGGACHHRTRDACPRQRRRRTLTTFLALTRFLLTPLILLNCRRRTDHGGTLTARAGRGQRVSSKQGDSATLCRLAQSSVPGSERKLAA